MYVLSILRINSKNLGVLAVVLHNWPLKAAGSEQMCIKSSVKFMDFLALILLGIPFPLLTTGSWHYGSERQTFTQN